MLLVLLVLMIAAPVIAATDDGGQRQLTNAIGQRVLRDLRARLYQNLQGLSLRFFTTSRNGKIQRRLANDVGELHSVITDTASAHVADAVRRVSTLVATLLAWQRTLLSLGITPLFVLLTGKVDTTRPRLSGDTQRALADMSALTEEALSVSSALLTKPSCSARRTALRPPRHMA